jgi:hypothetical protein
MTMHEKKIKVGVVGLGKRAHFYRTPLKKIAESGGIELIGVSRRRMGPTPTVDSVFEVPVLPLEELIRSADALILCTPCESTIGLAEKITAQGKNVFLETPLVAGERALLKIARRIRDDCIVVEVAHNLAASPEILFLKELQRDWKWGNLRRFTNHGWLTDYHALAIASTFGRPGAEKFPRGKARFRSDTRSETQELEFSGGFVFESVTSMPGTSSPLARHFEMTFENAKVAGTQIDFSRNGSPRTYSVIKHGQDTASFGLARLERLVLTDSEGESVSQFELPATLKDFSQHEFGLYRQLGHFFEAIHARDPGKCLIGFERAHWVAQGLKRLVLSKRLPTGIGSRIGDRQIDLLFSAKTTVAAFVKGGKA